MVSYPVMFAFRDAVSGNGFLAGVTLSGRALMVNEGEQEWCIYGVRPAPIAETGATPQEAYLRFHNRYKDVLFDIAGESLNFETFKQEVEHFYYETDEEEERRWEEAFQAIRCGEVIPEAPFFTALPKEHPEDRPSSISVARLDEMKRFQASDNVPDIFVMAAAA